MIGTSFGSFEFLSFPYSSNRVARVGIRGIKFQEGRGEFCFNARQFSIDSLFLDTS